LFQSHDLGFATENSPAKDLVIRRSRCRQYLSN
jgi:hypothetical protein